MALSNPSPPGNRVRLILRWLAAIFFVGAGANHFRHPDFYRQIVPPLLPSPALLVTISGMCEIAGGLGLLFPSLRRTAGWGLVALLIAVFPANLYMAFYPSQIVGLHISRWLLWVRLPLQAVMVGWVWLVAVREPPQRTA